MKYRIRHVSTRFPLIANFRTLGESADRTNSICDLVSFWYRSLSWFFAIDLFATATIPMNDSMLAARVRFHQDATSARISKSKLDHGSSVSRSFLRLGW